jgi:hypothetical protein
VYRPRNAIHPTLGHASDVVGIDVQADNSVADGRGIVCATGAQGLGQHDARPSVDDTIRLDGALIDRDASAYEIRTNFDELNAQSLSSGGNVGGGQYLGADGLGPNCHDNALLIKNKATS